MIRTKSEKGFVTRNNSFFKKVSIKPTDVVVGNLSPIKSSDQEQNIAKQNAFEEGSDNFE